MTPAPSAALAKLEQLYGRPMEREVRTTDGCVEVKIGTRTIRFGKHGYRACYGQGYGSTEEEAQEAARRAGAKITSTVSAKTNWVVVGANPGGNAARAKQLGVKILTEKEFSQIVR